MTENILTSTKTLTEVINQIFIKYSKFTEEIVMCIEKSVLVKKKCSQMGLRLRARGEMKEYIE